MDQTSICTTHHFPRKSSLEKHFTYSCHMFSWFDNWVIFLYPEETFPSDQSDP